jgi:hypothetical protein
MYMCVLSQRRHVYVCTKPETSCICVCVLRMLILSLYLLYSWLNFGTLPTLWYILLFRHCGILFFYFISLFTFTYRYFVTYRHSNTKFIIGAVHLLVLLITVTSFLIYLDQLLRSILLTMYIYKAMVITPNFTMLNVWI